MEDSAEARHISENMVIMVFINTEEGRTLKIKLLLLDSWNENQLGRRWMWVGEGFGRRRG